MAVTSEYVTYVADQCREFGAVTARRMFGGAGLYGDGFFFGLIADDTLFLKVDGGNRADYEAAGSQLFPAFPGGKELRRGLL